MKFFIKDLVTFTEVILNGNLHFLSSGNHSDAAERDCLGKKNCEKFHKTHKKTTLPESLLSYKPPTLNFIKEDYSIVAFL